MFVNPAGGGFLLDSCRKSVNVTIDPLIGTGSACYNIITDRVLLLLLCVTI